MDPVVGGLIIGGLIAVTQEIRGSNDKGSDKDDDKNSDYDNGCNCSVDQN